MIQKIKRFGAKRIAALALAAVMIAVLIPALGTRASAVASSLPHIQELKTGSNTFNIVEIVPSAGTGSIGYYVDGQEPTSNSTTGWKAVASTKSVIDRASYVNGVFQQLIDRGLMNPTVGTDADKYPLSYTAPYSEYKPWNSAAAGYQTLTLAVPETAVLPNSVFTKVETNQGDFSLNSEAAFVPDGSGAYVQDTDYFIYGTPEAGTIAAGDLYYYGVTFHSFDYTSGTVDGETLDSETTIDSFVEGLAEKHTALYLPVYKTNEAGAATSEIDHYKYDGTLGDGSGYKFNSSLVYYYVKDITSPVKDKNDTHGYYAVTGADTKFISKESNPFTVVKDDGTSYGETQGYFNIDNSKLTYVGSGRGDYKLTNESSGTAHTVTYDQVKYQGGYTNNNWLLKYVFDVADADMASVKANLKLQVFSVAPDSTNTDTTANLTGLLNGAGLVIISDGFKLSDGSAAGGYQKNAADLTDEQATLLKSIVDKGGALLLDSNVAANTADKDSNIQGLAKKLIGEQTTGFVSGSVYCFKRDDDRTALATPNFALKFTEDCSQTTSPYYPVWKEIDYENFLRGEKNKSITDASQKIDLLSTDISMATCVRYIINYSDRRVVNNKTEIRVLDVEPQTQKSGTSGKLTAAKVQEWLPEGTLTDDKITIDTMSSAEFISKIDDINEKYDLVYIGASLDNFNLNDGKPVYNDSGMDGLIYSNIGDVYKSGIKLSGLLDRDYDADSTFTGSDGKTYNRIDVSDGDAQTFRISGNDITAKKKTELTNFANSGLPVVVADELTTGGNASEPSREVTVTLSGSINTSGKLVFTATVNVSQKSTSYNYVYALYKKGGNVIQSFTASPDISKTFFSISPSTGKYYCLVTITDKSGKTYTATSNFVTLEQAASLYLVQGSTASTATVYPVQISGYLGRDKYNYVYDCYKVTVADCIGTVKKYDWQWKKQNENKWREFDEYTSYYSIDNQNLYCLNGNNYSYRCVVTTGKGIFYSQNCTSYPGYTVTDGNSSRYTLSVTTALSGETVTATAALTRLKGPSLTVDDQSAYDFEWANSNYYYYTVNSASLTPTEEGTYWCNVCLKGQNMPSNPATSQRYQYSNNWTATKDSAAGTAVTIDAVAGTDAAVNPDTVDNASVLYQTLSGIMGRTNVMSVSEAKAQQTTVVKYLNLSKPSILFSTNADGSEKKPASYTGINNIKTNLNDGTLEYTFKILNSTDPTPQATRYTCRLFVDTNSDGRYRADEEIGEVRVWDSKGNEVSVDSLVAGEEYTVKRTLPDTFRGMIPWQLKVVQNGSNDQIHASETGYTYKLVSQPTSIKILQVYKSGDLKLTNHKDEAGNVLGNSTYNDLYKKISDVYALDITSISVDTFNEWHSDITDREQRLEAVKADLAGYDMLIMGFGDCYGSLIDLSADAVVSYISSGKAILFTHDTTSFSNVPVTYEENGKYYWQDGYYDWYGDWHAGSYVFDTNTHPTFESEWGYYFNTILRDPVGLDRYGVTDTTYGSTKYQSGKSTSGTVAAGYSDATASTVADLLKNGYSVAFEPKSAVYNDKGELTSFKTVSETQGFTKFELVRYSNGGGYPSNTYYPTVDGNYGTKGDNNQTNAVSQVNQGQITTYPFNINTTDFDPSNTAIGKTLTVATTHDQYYQLNMNSDDIVVWYCLSSGTVKDKDGNTNSTGANFASSKNDGVNGYYIYNRGNVTYSGAGHTTGTVSEPEAKLFINTMIAAYRAAAVNPTVSFENSAGEAQDTQFLPVEYKSSGSASSEAVGSVDTRVYFTIKDPNVSAAKTTTASFYTKSGSVALTDEQVKEIASGKTTVADLGFADVSAPDIYVASTGKSAKGSDGSYNLKGDVLYYMDLASSGSTLSDFLLSGDAEMTLLVKVTTRIGTVDYTGVDTITIRKMGYMNLR